MYDDMSNLHRGWLVATALLTGILGLAFAFAPGALLDRMAAESSSRILGIVRVGGSVLLAECVITALAAWKGSWSAGRLITYLVVAHFSIETALRVWAYAMGESSSLVAAIPQAVIAVGLGVELVRRSARRGAPATT